MSSRVSELKSSKASGDALEAELASPAAGQFGVPVNAVCVGCGRTRVKRASLEAMDHEPEADPAIIEASDCTSFKHVCYPCQGATWWNPVAILTGLFESERDRGE